MRDFYRAGAGPAVSGGTASPAPCKKISEFFLKAEVAVMPALQLLAQDDLG
jgi:hypothetical protein